MTESRSEPPLVDVAALSAYARDELPGEGPLEVTRLAAGHSNLTFVVTRGERSWILRRPPKGPLLPTAHDVIREYRVLSLLEHTPARVPTPTFACEDPTVIGVPFYLMEQVPGEVIREKLPDWAGEPQRHQLGLDLVTALAELHAVDPTPFVANGIGKPDGYLARQLKRWRGQREGAKTRELPDYDVLSRWLEDNLPPQTHSSVVHGDYKLDNVIVSGPKVAAILDWEMATVGDPLADLGYLLSFWLEPGERDEFAEVAGNVTTQPGFPTRSEMIERYAATSGRAVDEADLTPYVVLAVWKLAILLEASYSRHLAGTTDDPFFALLDRGVPALLAKARRIADA